MVRQFSRLAAITFFSLFLVAGCAIQKNPVTGTTRFFGYSWQQELQIGADADPEIVTQFGLYDDEKVAEYIVEIGELILAESHMRREETDRMFRETEFTFRILDTPVVNAFALPGGYIYFTRGMMAHLNNEAQFAVVMGHEIGHVAARHASQRALRQTLGQIIVVGGAILGQELLGLPGQTILELSSLTAQLLFLSYSRDNERESDRLGVEYAARSGYDAAEGAELFRSLQRISERYGRSIPNFISTHPDPGERYQTIPRVAEEWRERGLQQEIRNQDRYMELVEGMIFGINPRQGFAKDGFFYHPDLEFQFEKPESWDLINQPSQVVLLSPEEEAISIFRIDASSETPRESVQALLQQDGIELIEESAAMSSDRWEAWKALASAELQDGTEVTLQIYAVSYGGRIYRFLSYTRAQDFERFESDFNRIIRSFDSLVDEDILAIRPVQLDVFRATRDGRFHSFLPAELPMEIDPEEVAIINQRELDDPVTAGEWLKIPVQQ